MRERCTNDYEDFWSECTEGLNKQQVLRFVDADGQCIRTLEESAKEENGCRNQLVNSTELWSVLRTHFGAHMYYHIWMLFCA